MCFRYYGGNMRNRKIRGIFPKTYVALKECHVDKITTVEEVIPKEPAIIKEITAVSSDHLQIMTRCLC